MEEAIKAFLDKEGVKEVPSVDVVEKTGVFVSVLRMIEGQLELRCGPISIVRSIVYPDANEMIVYFRETVACTAVVSDFGLEVSLETDAFDWNGDTFVFKTCDLKKILIHLDSIIDKYEYSTQGIDERGIARAILNAARILAKAKLDKETIRASAIHRKAELEMKESIEMERMKRETARLNAERRCKYKAESEKLRAQLERLHIENEKLKKKIHQLKRN